MTARVKRTGKQLTESKTLAATQGVENRRNLVRGYQKQHLPVREIAEKCKVKLSTIEADIKWLDKEAAGLFRTDELGRKSRELAELDSMEADAMKYETRYSRLADQYEKEPGTFTEMQNKMRIDTARMESRYWFNKRLEIKEKRAKWLWFDQKPKEEIDSILTQDNRRFIINIHGRDRDIMEYLDGGIRELQAPVEVIDSV